MPQQTLLQTKLYIPPVRPELVSRPRLIDRLREGRSSGGRLTLVSAPAGFGKTTLVSEWIAARDGHRPPAAWLSLDQGDNDPTRFLVYLIAALQTLSFRASSGIEASIGEAVLGQLQSSESPPTELTLTALLNDIATVPEDFILVLDDYHVIDSPPVGNVLTFLVEHLPPQMHLVIATREDPHLPLARLRVRDQLTEIRATNLRFTPSEAAVFFNQVMGLNLSPDEVISLETRTEGWIAGLQLAALSMRGREDVSGFIGAFAGDNRYIVDYLVEEVLQRQSERIRSFLLQTSILDRLGGSLCDAVRFGPAMSPGSSTGTAATGPDDGRAVLVALERGNLFVVPLDDKRQWYRYHHLFGDVLRAHLMEEQPGLVPTLHLRASEWYEANGSPADAMRHALAAGDFALAADVSELAWKIMDDTFQTAAWLDWAKKLPDEVIRDRPVLSTQVASALMEGGELEASEARLRDAERWLDPQGPTIARPAGPSDGTGPERGPSMVVVDEEQFALLPAKIALVRTMNAQAVGDLSAAVKHGQLALSVTPEEDQIGRAQATALLGFTYWASGDLEEAHRAMAGWIASMHEAGNSLFAIASTFALADIMVAQGRLQESVEAYEKSLRLASEHGEDVQRVAAHLHLGLAMLYHEMDDRDAAALHLQRAGDLGERTGLADWPYRWRVALAQVEESRGDLEAALNLLDEAEGLYVRVTAPNIRPIEALKAKVYISQGTLPKALAWVQERGLSVDDEPSYLVEFEHITLARLLIARYKSGRADRTIHEALGLLERLLQAAEDRRRMGSVIEILVLQALAHQARGDTPLALSPLKRALALAGPEGYVRIFVDEGPPMAALLTEILKARGKGRGAAAVGFLPNYVGQLLGALGKAGSKAPVSQLLMEPLSKRELQVLGLLGTELSGPEIASELGVSLTTIRTHTQNIYGKLGVNNRRAAVRRGDELDLL